MYFAPKNGGRKLLQTGVITAFETANGNVRSLKFNSALGVFFPPYVPPLWKTPFCTHSSRHPAHRPFMAQTLLPNICQGFGKRLLAKPRYARAFFWPFHLPNEYPGFIKFLQDQTRFTQSKHTTPTQQRGSEQTTI